MEPGGFMKTPKVQKKEPASICGRLCGGDQVTYLITRLDLIQGELLEILESQEKVSLHGLMKAVEWSPCAVAMSVGSLMGKGLVLAVEEGEEVFLEIAPNELEHNRRSA